MTGDKNSKSSTQKKYILARNQPMEKFFQPFDSLSCCLSLHACMRNISFLSPHALTASLYASKKTGLYKTYNLASGLSMVHLKFLLHRLVEYYEPQKDLLEECVLVHDRIWRSTFRYVILKL